MPSHKRRTHGKRHTRHAKKTHKTHKSRKTQKSQKRGGMNRVGRQERERPVNYERQRNIAARGAYGRLRMENLAPPNNRMIIRNLPALPPALVPVPVPAPMNRGVIPRRPNNVEGLQIIEIEPDNAVNAVTFEDIRFDQPVLVLDNEHRFQRVYQSNDSIADLRQTMRNPHTRNPIRSAVWMKPVRRNPQ
jgi:hypothetical protein